MLDPFAIRTTGRATVTVSGSFLRPLEEADLVLLSAEKGSHASPIKRLSQRHHSLARNLASGMKPGEAAIVCGYDPSRVSILQADPSFQELVVFYREDVDRAYADLHERLAGLAVDAVEEIAKRLDDEPDKISTSLLNEIVKTAADRTGYGPASKTTANVNITVGVADRLEAARKRVAERQMKTITLEAVHDNEE